MDFLDKVVGIYHFLGDKIPADIPDVEPKPRRITPWLKDDKVVVAKVAAQGDIRSVIIRAILLLGNLEQVIHRGDRVMIKPNFNSPDPFPAATDLTFLRAAIELILEIGAHVTIGESSGGMWRPSRKVFWKLGVPELARKMGVELIAFDDRPRDWVRIMVNGDYLERAIMPRSAYEADKLVYLPCMKTHSLSWFSGALKLSIGFVAPGQRRNMHLSNLQQKLAEVNMCWQPDAIIMDGRKAFVTGGPDKGQLVEPGVVIASGDLVATDIEAIKVLLAYGADNRLPTNPWQLPQVVTALKHRLGAGKDGYILIE